MNWKMVYGNEERLETVNEGYAKAQMKGDGLGAEKPV